MRDANLYCRARWEIHFQITSTQTIGHRKAPPHLKRYFPENTNTAGWPQGSVRQEVA